MGIDRDYIDDAWCPSCQEETRQEFHDTRHERDSSMDSRRCTVCGKTGYGLTGFEEYS